MSDVCVMSPFFCELLMSFEFLKVDLRKPCGKSLEVAYRSGSESLMF